MGIKESIDAEFQDKFIHIDDVIIRPRKNGKNEKSVRNEGHPELIQADPELICSHSVSIE